MVHIFVSGVEGYFIYQQSAGIEHTPAPSQFSHDIDLVYGCNDHEHHNMTSWRDKNKLHIDHITKSCID